MPTASLLSLATLPLAALLLGTLAPAQQLDFERAGQPLATAPADPAITAALAKISPEHIQETITRLVSFGTRNTLSSNEKDLPAGQGILAAATWIHAEFDRISATCNGCLEVHDDDFLYTPPAGETVQQSRFNGPTPLRNVYAILRGSDPAQAARIVLVTGHYDTRRTDVMDARNAAPGANDDSSGTAVSLECARVLAGTHLPGTVIFVAVAGEEQGLTGSHHLAELAKQQNWQLEAVLNNDIVGGDTTPGDTLQSKSVVRVFSQGLLPSMSAPELRTALITGADSDTPSRQLAREVLAVARTYTSPPGTTQPSNAPGTATPASHAVISTEAQRSGETPALSATGTPPSSALAANTPSSDALRPVMELRLDRYLRGGDHSSFSALGFPAVRFTEWRENFDHQHQDLRTERGTVFGDLLQFDDFRYIARVARLNAATLATLASSPGTPTEVRVVTRELDNNTTLRWQAPASSAPNLHYQIVWRETTANDWQFAAEATRYPFLPVPQQPGAPASTGKSVISSSPAATSFAATLPISKDNVFFGVRACDTAGHCSPAAAPAPER